jgi:hypothetical protein
MDKGVTSRLYGNYRAVVVENRDNEKFGRVLVWIPDLMPDIPSTTGIWARPANNPMGGRNTQYGSDNNYMGTCYIPRKGSWLWIFFEAGNINRPYYFASLDIEHAKVLPENQVGTNFQDKWTIFKSHDGRTVIISDDPDDERIEITGKKRKLNTPPSGDTASVYQIDTNQTTILFDERTGKQKILIRTYKGDFFHIDIDERKLQVEFEGDIEIKTKGKFNVTAEDDINIKSLTGDAFIQSDSGDINIKGGGDVKITSAAEMDLLSQNNLNYQSGGDINGLAGGNMNHDAAQLNEQTGMADAASEAPDATEADPKGERNT